MHADIVDLDGRLAGLAPLEHRGAAGLLRAAQSPMGRHSADHEGDRGQNQSRLDESAPDQAGESEDDV